MLAGLIGKRDQDTANTIAQFIGHQTRDFTHGLNGHRNGLKLVGVGGKFDGFKGQTPSQVVKGRFIKGHRVLCEGLQPDDTYDGVLFPDHHLSTTTADADGFGSRLTLIVDAVKINIHKGIDGDTAAPHRPALVGMDVTITAAKGETTSGTLRSLELSVAPASTHVG
ncbi:MAG: hypothetical protein BWY72_02267 [Bacteroidetes bacterium ADurb.Bin416]|nr:MAG: hypothetical protein BWY72_02267 [Bacteroidetes bacterium ADurb.Bin416]